MYNAEKKIVMDDEAACCCAPANGPTRTIAETMREANGTLAEAYAQIIDIRRILYADSDNVGTSDLQAQPCCMNEEAAMILRTARNIMNAVVEIRQGLS